MKKALLSLTIISLFSARLVAQMVVTSPVPPAALAAAITGGGITVSNVTTNGATSTSQGTFTSSGLGNIGIASGILITSGSASVAAAPNTGTGQGASINNLGDPQLAALTTGIIHDASILEFDFIAVSDTVIFNYVFGSDEYSDYVNSQFNDVFGFFISGPGITGYQNIALIPGTTIPIAINNVNNGGPVGHGIPPPGPCTNCAYFLDNSAPVTYSTAYDGLTTVLTATAVNLQPGLTYHLKLAVSDAGDQVFDSGSFIEAGSFLTPAPPWVYVGGLRVTDDTLQICSGNSVQLSVPSGFSYLWSTGATTQAITVNTAGVYNVTVTGSNALIPVFSNPMTFVVVTSSVTQPVLSQNGNNLISSVTNPNYGYSWTFNGMPVPGVTSSSFYASQAGCYSVTVQDPGGCFASSDTLCIGITGIAENGSQSFHRISPNPFNQSGELVFENKAGESFTLKIFDLTGTEQRKDVNIISGSYSIEKQNLSVGIYFYDLRNESGTITYKGKFVIN